MESALNILLAVVQLLLPIVIIIYTFVLRRNMKKINERSRRVLEDYMEHSREIAMTEFLSVNPEIDPEIFVEKKEPIVPKRDKPRHHFNHEGGDYFM